MKDKNGIDICCENCRHYEYCDDKFYPHVAKGGNSCNFEVSNKALEARIADIDDINDTLIEVYEDKIKELEESFFATVELLGEIGQECDRLREEVKILKAFVLKVHTSPVIFEDTNRALRDEAKTLLEKLNQSAESKDK